jgi:hypothetical protein
MLLAALVTLPLVVVPTQRLDVPLGAFTDQSTNVTGALTLGPGTARTLTPVRSGIAVYPPRTLPKPANSVNVDVDATVPEGTTVTVGVRGERPDHDWTEWTPGTLGVSTSVIQVRVVLTAPDDVGAPTVHRVSLSTSDGPRREPAANEYRVFATREGLVGGTTANGHVITSRDHFVALPSRRGLSPKGTGTYTTKVCAANGRCAWAPVWDVGPWNTHDDYWNPTRETWTDLPEGTPQAQAAYQDGYNKGLDQFGRKVANPAGIDLADGTFWDGLALKGNSWVTVTYLWHQTGPSGYVRTAGDTLNARTSPSTDAPVTGIAANHAQVRVECQATGETVNDSAAWYRIAPRMYVAAAFVTGVTNAPTCAG